MGILTPLTRLFYPGAIESRSSDGFTSIGGLTDSRFLDAMNLNAGSVSVTTETALRLATVFRCVDLLSSTAAVMPWELFRKHAGRREPAVNHPNYSLYKVRPSKLQTSFIWRKTIFTHALLWGNGYAKIIRNGVYRPVSLKLYHPNLVTVTEYQDELYYSFDGQPPVPSSEVIHLKLFTTDGLSGRSVIRMAADSLKGPLHAQRFYNSFMENGARVSGVLTNPNKMDMKAKTILGEAWKAFTGSGSGGTPILDEGVKYEQIGIPPGDFQLMESMGLSDKTICTWFGVPQHLAGILDNATFSNIEHQDLEYMKYSLDPHLVNFEQEVDYKTLRTAELGEYYTRLNRNSMLRTDIKTRYESYRTAIQNGFMSPNMAMELEDMNPIEGGDRHFIQMNMMPFDKIDEVINSKQLKPAQAPSEPAPKRSKELNGHALNGHSVPTDN